jgi:hypothetical protein
MIFGVPAVQHRPQSDTNTYADTYADRNAHA